jgi:sec-independent protein translocase protein TatB
VFGLSGGDLLTLVVLAFVLMGPNRLPENFRKLAVFIKKVRDFAQTAAAELKQELGPEFKDLDLNDLNPKALLKRQIGEVLDPTSNIENSDTPLEPNPNRKVQIDPDLL